MNTAPNKNNQNDMHEGTDFTVRRTRSTNVIAAVLCIMLAVALWLVVMQLEQTDTVTLTLKGAPDAYACVLSDTMIDVKGTTLTLKRLETVEVVCPAWIKEPGTYYLSPADIRLPEGVTLAEEFLLTVTVVAK